MGIRGETVTDVSQRLLAHHGGLRGLLRLDVAELAHVRGLGDAKAVRVKAALELGRRLAALSPEERPPVGSPEDVANLLGIEMAALEQEQLRVVLLDTKHRILGTRTVYQGSVNHDREAGCWKPFGPGHGQGEGFPPTRSFTPQDDTLLQSQRRAFNPVHRCAPPPQ
jgi:DNA repair protein RadC